jgi:hypothetical protein
MGADAAPGPELSEEDVPAAEFVAVRFEVLGLAAVERVSGRDL